MGSKLIEYRLRVRTADDLADELLVSTVRGDPLPYLEGPPSIDGTEFDPLTGNSRSGASTWRIIDAITSGTDRVLTSKLEDAGFRQQLIRRKAMCEIRVDGGAWGTFAAHVITRVLLVGAAVYEVAVSDPVRLEGKTLAFAPKPNADTALADKGKFEPFADYLARWPKRGCFFGGPVIGGFGPVADRKGWEMTVAEATAGLRQRLILRSAYWPPGYARISGLGPVAERVNAIGRPHYRAAFSESAFPDLAPSGFRSNWPDLVYAVEPVVGGAVTYRNPTTPIAFTGSTGRSGYDELAPTIGVLPTSLWVIGTGLTVGAAVRVRGLTALPTEESPIYYTGHPVDLWAALMAEAGQATDAAAVAAAKDAIGAGLRISIRITEPRERPSFLEEALYGPFGFSVRTNGAGQLAPFVTRIFANSAPAVTLTSADVQMNEDGTTKGKTFELDEAGAIGKLIFEHEVLAPDTDPDDPSPDGVRRTPYRFERTNADAGAVSGREVSLRIPGTVHLEGSFDGGEAMKGFVEKLGHELFDRFGRGALTGEVTTLRGAAGDGLQLGDELLNALPQLPNHNKRLGDDPSVAARRLQIVRVTPISSGAELKLVDSGPNAQPVATLPTHTIAASVGNPRTVAELTITNAAALNAASIGVRIQVAVTTGAAPALTDYADVLIFAPGQVPATAILLPAVLSGRTVYARGRGEQPDKPPSNWQVGVGVTLTVINAPTGLTATPHANGAHCELAWTIGANASELRTNVYLRLGSESASAALPRISLPPASTRHTIEGLTIGTQYTAGAQHYDPSTGDVSATTEVTFTAGALGVTLGPLHDPTGFSGAQDPAHGLPDDPGLYGLAIKVMAQTQADLAIVVEFEEAVETAVGSGSYGVFALAGARPMVHGGWTIYSSIAPNDGKKRLLRARATRPGATSSAYTADIEVLPWTAKALPMYAFVVESVSLNNWRIISETATHRTYGCNPGSAVASIWIYDQLVAAPIIGDPFGVFAGQLPHFTFPPIPNFQYTVEKVLTPGNHRLLQAEPRLLDLSVKGEIQQEILDPVPDPLGAVVLEVSGTGLDASVIAHLSGANSVGSWRYAVSEISMPSDATAAAGTIVAARQASVVVHTTLRMGETLFLKVIPYTGTAGDGTALPSIEGRAMRQNKTTTKTLLWSALGLNPWKAPLPVGQSMDKNAVAGYVGPNADEDSLELAREVVLPDGLTVTGFVSLTFRSASDDACAIAFYKINRSTRARTALAQHTNNTAGSIQTITTTGLSEVVDNATYIYVVDSAQIARNGALSSRIYDYGVTYDQADLSQGY